MGGVLRPGGPVICRGLVVVSSVELWASDNGRVCCPNHLGYSASAERSANPRARRLVTSLGSWSRLSSADVAEWSAFLAGEGVAVLCEGCRS